MPKAQPWRSGCPFLLSSVPFAPELWAFHKLPMQTVDVVPRLGGKWGGLAGGTQDVSFVPRINTSTNLCTIGLELLHDVQCV